MKTILTLAFVAFLTVTTSAVATDLHPSYTQNTTNSCFSFFRVHRQQNGAGMMWGVNKQGVKEFLVERSEDGQYFEAVTTLPANGAAQYRHTDNEVFPGLISYRITAVMEDGSNEVSPIQQVRIVSRR